MRGFAPAKWHALFQTYDGDVAFAARGGIREAAAFLLTNPAQGRLAPVPRPATGGVPRPLPWSRASFQATPGRPAGDMVHCNILPHHAQWSDWLASLRYVVLDEAAPLLSGRRHALRQGEGSLSGLQIPPSAVKVNDCLMDVGGIAQSPTTRTRRRTQCTLIRSHSQTHANQHLI